MIIFIKKSETVNNTPKTFRGKRVLASRLESDSAQIFLSAFYFSSNGDETQRIVEAFADIILGFGGSSEWFAQLECRPEYLCRVEHNLHFPHFPPKEAI